MTIAAKWKSQREFSLRVAHRYLMEIWGRGKAHCDQMNRNVRRVHRIKGLEPIIFF